MSSYFLIKEEILPRPYYLITIFGKSNWIHPHKKKEYLNDRYKYKTVTYIRKTEDENFAELLNLKLIFFNLEDCLLRNGEVFYKPNKKLDTDLVNKVKIIIDTSIKKCKVRNIVVPFPSGLKQHYDHRIVYEALMLLTTKSCNRFFVDDIPYSRVVNPDKYNLRLFAKLKITNLYEKFQAMKIYNSQMCKLFFDQVQKITMQNKKYERLFLLIN